MRCKVLASLFLLVFTFACKDKRIEKIEGKWIGLTEKDGMVEFNGDGTSFWNTLSKRDFRFVEDNLIEVTWMTAKKKLDIEMRGDTLVLTGPESRNKFIKFETIEKSDVINQELIGRKIFEGRGKQLLELKVEKTDLEKLKQKILFEENRITKLFKPDVQLYYATALLVDSSRVELVGQPALQMPHLDILVHETLESRILGHFNNMFGYSMLSTIAIDKKNQQGFNGTVSNDKGEKFKFFIQLGQAPMLDIDDLPTLNTGMRYLLDKQLGYKTCEKVEFENGGKKGTAHLKNNVKLGLNMTDKGEWNLAPDAASAKVLADYAMKNAGFGDCDIKSLKPMKDGDFDMTFAPKANPEYLIKAVFIGSKADWYPVEDVKNLENTVLAMLNRKVKVAKSLTFTAKGKGIYEGEAFAVKEGVPSRKIMLKHNGKSFMWEMVREKTNRKYSARDESELEAAGAAQDLMNMRVRKVKPIIGNQAR